MRRGTDIAGQVGGTRGQSHGRRRSDPTCGVWRTSTDHGLLAGKLCRRSTPHTRLDSAHTPNGGHGSCRPPYPTWRGSRMALVQLLPDLISEDPTHWVQPAVSQFLTLTAEERTNVLAAISASANIATPSLLAETSSPEASELRRTLIHRFADRLFVRTLGALAIHRNGWTGPAITVGRKRTRLLLGILLANMDSGLTREMVLDSLWPDADPSAGVNSLNQTVFQLRRLIDPGYREGDSPQYVISTVDIIQLNTDLVTTDLIELRRIASSLQSGGNNVEPRRELLTAMLDLVRGEYLADMRYEDWVDRTQLLVHSEIREMLMPLASGQTVSADPDISVRAAGALALLDPYDEAAHVALARVLAETGRRFRGRDLLIRLAGRLRSDLDAEPSEETVLAAARLGTDIGRGLFD